MKTAKATDFDGWTPEMLKHALLQEKYNRLDASLEWSQITENDDPRIKLSLEINRHLASLTAAEIDALEAHYGV